MFSHIRLLYPRRKCRRRNLCRNRKCDGTYIVEILVALIIGAVLAFALCNTLGEALRITSTSVNETYANSVVENLLECSRSLSYPKLSALKGQTFEITDSNAIQTGFTLHQFPLLMDLTNSWDRVKSEKFRGIVKYQIAEGPENGNSLTITVSATWSDSNWHTAPRTVSRSMVRIDPNQLTL